MNAAACVTTIAINLYPTTYLVAAYGSLKDHPAESYVGLQNIRNEIYICSRLNNLCQSPQDPIACRIYKGTSPRDIW